MIHYDEYLYFKKEIKKKPCTPYMMHNHDLSKSFYEEIKKEYPDASYHVLDITQWICLNDKARKKLRSIFMKRIQRQEDELRRTVTFMHEVEKNIGSN